MVSQEGEGIEALQIRVKEMQKIEYVRQLIRNMDRKTDTCCVDDTNSVKKVSVAFGVDVQTSVTMLTIGSIRTMRSGKDGM